jgi:fibronectin-binding autotransporter adhesin
MISQAGETCGPLTIGGSGNNTVKMTAGNLTVLSTYLGELVGNNGPGAFVQSGGTHAVIGATAALEIGNGSNSGSGSYTLSGGSLFANYIYVGNVAQGAFTQSAGTCSVAKQLTLGYSVGTSGSYCLQGNGLLLAKQEVVGYQGTSTFTQSGGTNVIYNRLVLGQNQGYSGSYYLEGGVLSFGTLSAGSGSASLTIGGGTLLTGPTSSCSVPISIAPSSNAVFNTGGGTLAISAGLNGGGGLTKSGAGLLVLSGSDSYAAGTTVSAGTLVFLGADSVPNGGKIAVGANASVQFVSMHEGSSANVLAVPEPSTVALLVIAFPGIVGCRGARRLYVAKTHKALHRKAL